MRVVVALVFVFVAVQARAEIAWTTAENSLARRFVPPAGFTRVEVERDSFADYLRKLPVLPGRPQVHLFDGRSKANQRAQAAVLDIDVGDKDLQQCADFVIRLRAEYLRASHQANDICFRFTSGHAAAWTAFRDGARPVIRGSQVSWAKTASKDDSPKTFRRYLDTVFTYAGTQSLTSELTRVQDPNTLVSGDVFIQPGSPGHAVIVLDVAVNAKNQRAFLLAQSYMPAQEPHVLVRPGSESAWYLVDTSRDLETPEWRFTWRDLRRFSARGCP